MLKVENLSCAICGSARNIVNHHISYRKNLTASLCTSCHRKVHGEHGHKYYPVDGEEVVLFAVYDSEFPFIVIAPPWLRGKVSAFLESYVRKEV